VWPSVRKIPWTKLRKVNDHNRICSILCQSWKVTFCFTVLYYQIFGLMSLLFPVILLVPERLGSKSYALLQASFRKVNKHWALLCYYAAINGVFLETFRYNISVLSWRVKFKIGPIGCPETAVRNYHHSLRNNPEERSSQASHMSDFYKLNGFIQCRLSNATSIFAFLPVPPHSQLSNILI